jgi:pyridinium-3,5-biscarboxylic acid mononucleotide synthase
MAHNDRLSAQPSDSNGAADALDELLLAAAAFGSGNLDVPTLTLDLDRHTRKGVPEVILADRKRIEDVVQAATAFLAKGGRALISRVDAACLERLRAEFADSTVDVHAASRMVVIKCADYEAKASGGRVGIITAGSSDLPIAEEAALVAREMGCGVQLVYDVGVAGLHRLARPLRDMLAAEVDVIVVAAGMDGALPSVVAGLVPVPVIGLPTSVGYGAGGRGLAALLSMLQTCSPGLTVVNIDNGVGAGASAALIANRMAAARQAAATGTPDQLAGPPPLA